MKSKPWLKFYVQDWISDPALSLCSLAEKGLLIDIMALAHNGEPYGYVTNGGQALTQQELGRALSVNWQTVSKAMAGLKHRRRIGVTQEGVIYVPRMVKDGLQQEQASKDGAKSWDYKNKPTHKGDDKGTPSTTLDPEGEGEQRQKQIHKQKRKTYNYTPEFHELWKQYPNSSNKPDALEAFQGSGVELDVLLKAIDNQRKWKDRLRKKGDFVPSWPALHRWLKNHRFEDEEPESVKAGPAQDGPLDVVYGGTHG